MSLPTSRTPGYGLFRGKVACVCLIEWLPVFEAELVRRGILRNPSRRIRIWQLTGGAAASGGTHSRGGAFDTDQVSRDAIWVARQMGADATWHRPHGWDGRGGMEHAHGVLVGCPHNVPARYQIAAVDADYNGLGWGGRGGRDTGPRPLSGRSWRQGIAWAKNLQQPKEWDEMASKDEIKAAIREVLQEQLVKTPDPLVKRGYSQTKSIPAALYHIWSVMK